MYRGASRASAAHSRLARFPGLRGLLGIGHGVDFGLAEQAVTARRNGLEREWAEADTLHFLYRMILAEQDAAQPIHFPAEHPHFVPEIGGTAASGVRLTNGLQLDAGFLTETIEFFKREASLDFDVVELSEARPIFQHLRGEPPIVRKQNETTGSVIETPDRVDTLRKPTKKVTEGLASFGIRERRDDLGGLVHQQIGVPLFGLHRATGGLDFVLRGIGFAAEFGDGLTVDPNLAGKNQLLGVTPGSDARVSDNLLKTFEHGGVRIAEAEKSATAARCGKSRHASRRMSISHWAWAGLHQAGRRAYLRPWQRPLPRGIPPLRRALVRPWTSFDRH